MIVCVGLNPALDRRIVLRSLELGGINRALSAEGSPGGKAANVALAARALGARVCFAGFLGGPTGEAVARGLRERGIEVDAETTLAATRINLELIDEHGVTEVLEPGSAPSDAELSRLLTRCQSLFESCELGSVVAFSGSLPQGSQSYLYARLIELAKPRGLRIILDTSGSWLEDGIGAGPDFVKPNRQEAEALLGRPVTTPEQACGAIDDLIQRGARDAVVSLGADGLVGRDTGRAFWIRPPTLRTRSAVGCGDSTVAGLAVALQRGDPNPQKLAFAAACGAANCLATSPACLDPAAVSQLLERTRVQWLD